MKKYLLFCLTCFLFLSNFNSFSQQILWEKGFNPLPSGQDLFIVIRKVDDSTIIASGVSGTLPYGSFYTHYHINGTLNWSGKSRTLKTAEQDIRPFGKGYFYASQVPLGASSGVSAMLQRLGSFGDTLWTKVYSAYQNDVVSKLLLAHNSVYLGGQGSDTPLGYGAYFLMKTDTSGTLQWRKKYRTAWGDAYLCDMVLRPNGNIVLSGKAPILPANKFQHYIVEVNPNGDSLRSKVIFIKGPNYGVDHNRIYQNLILASDGNYICSGTVDSAGYRMPYAAKIDTAFNLLWARIIKPVPGQQLNIASRIKELPNGNYALLTNDVPNNNKFYLHTISPNGQLVNKTTYISSFCSQLNLWSWEVLPDGGGIVAGGCTSNAEAYIARFGSFTIGTKEELLSAKFGINRLYPNPAQTEATVAFSLPLGTRQAAVTISDLAGRIIASYPIVSKGTGEVQLSLQGFKSGLYNCTLLIDGKPTGSRKLSIIR